MFGKTVNVAAVSLRKECSLLLTPAMFRKLSPAVRTQFRKHTPPIAYIGIDDPRPH